MNLNDVRLFIQVIEHNSFTSAADKLGIQKSTISRRIAQLEDELGVRLLQRTTRKLSLTDEGENLYRRCHPLFDELDTIEDYVTSRQEEPKGRLRITMPLEISIFIMNDVISSFLHKYPLIQLDMELSARLVDLVEEGIDLALRVGDLSDSSLIGRKIADASSELYASVNYLEKYGVPETPDDLISHQCIGTNLGSNDWVFENWEAAKPVPINFRLRANSLSFCREMIKQDLGIGRMPKAFCIDDINAGLVREVLPDYKVPSVGIHALYPSRKHLNPRIRLFIDHMIASLKTHPWLSHH
ncbi:LysR family transcriptional regulator [uncultured Neptuniibacter sp.]|uniref:LysR family transcriptional regulator n=1 Tax=uncultured Neptuniibacter sp. TaxID=502143 RepID=UPI00261BD9A7|nr:LysR family transcriptional regulator [uncultured Neptuniibacter sp.]